MVITMHRTVLHNTDHILCHKLQNILWIHVSLLIFRSCDLYKQASAYSKCEHSFLLFRGYSSFSCRSAKKALSISWPPSPSPPSSPHSLFVRLLSSGINISQLRSQLSQHAHPVKSLWRNAKVGRSRTCQGQQELCVSNVGVVVPGLLAAVGVGGWWWSVGNGAAQCKVKPIHNRLVGNDKGDGGEPRFPWGKLWVLLLEDIWCLLLAVVVRIAFFFLSVAHLLRLLFTFL